MFNNISEKLKELAGANFALGIIVAVVWCIVAIINEDDDFVPLVLPWLLGGMVSIFIISMFIYAFGQLVGDVREIKEKMLCETASDSDAKKADELPEL